MNDPLENRRYHIWQYDNDLCPQGAAQVSTIFLDENYVRMRTSRAVSNFMARRADQITANAPDLAERMQKRSGMPTGGPVGFIAEGDLDNNKLSYSTSLRRIAGFSDDRKAARREGLHNLQAFGQLNLASGADTGLEENGLDIWVQGEVSQIDNQTSDTDLGQLYVGLDYRHTQPERCDPRATGFVGPRYL